MRKIDTKQRIKITSLLLFFSVLAIWALFYFIISDYIAENTKKQTALASNKIIESLGGEFSRAERILYNLTQNEDAKKLLFESSPGENIQVARSVAGSLGASLYSPDLFEHIILFQSDSVYYRLSGKLGNKLCSMLYNAAALTELPNHIAIELDGKKYIGYADNIFPSGGERHGIAVILITEEQILEILQTYDQSGSLLVAIRADGEIVAANTDMVHLFNQDGNSQEVHSRIGITPYEISVIAESRYLNASVIYFSTVAAITAAIFGIAIFVYIGSLNRRFFRPMVKVARSIENLNTEVSTETLPHVRSEEFDGLIDKINEMLVNLDNKNNEIKSAQLRAKNAEIEQQKSLVFSLKKQINAHFTINTLEIMRLLVEQGDLEKAETVATGLITLFRYAHDKDERINIWDEYEVLEQYVAIMNIRYDGKLNVDFDFDDRLMKYNMPRMLLQPILENSVVHGFAGMTSGCLISVKARQHGNTIIFTLSDNGRGMSAEKLEALRERLSVDPEAARGFENIALVNIRNRLYHYYGGAGQININSGENSGFEVIVSLSVMEEQEVAQA